MDSFSLIIKSMASVASHNDALLVLRDFKNRLWEIDVLSQVSHLEAAEGLEIWDWDSGSWH